MRNDRIDSINDGGFIPLWKACPILQHAAMDTDSFAANISSARGPLRREGLAAFSRNSTYAAVLLGYIKRFHPPLNRGCPLLTRGSCYSGLHLPRPPKRTHRIPGTCHRPD